MYLLLQWFRCTLLNANAASTSSFFCWHSNVYILRLSTARQHHFFYNEDELENREIFISCDRTYEILDLGGRSCSLFASTGLILWYILNFFFRWFLIRLSLESGFFYFLIPLDAFDIQVSSETRFGLQEAKNLSSTPGSHEQRKFSSWCFFVTVSSSDMWYFLDWDHRVWINLT